MIKGGWFSDEQTNGISLSDDIAERYRLNVGDTVFLKVEDRIIETYVQSLRTVNWDNFSPNFLSSQVRHY